MRILLDTSLIRDPRAVALLARGALQLMIDVNVQMMRAHGPRVFPPLYKSGIKFGPEPWQGKFEEFAPAIKVLARGWGDCDDLVLYRVAELIVFGDRLSGSPPEQASPRIYGRDPGARGGRMMMHAQVRRENGLVEDPSRLLPRVRTS